jgi:hypothetical protein
VRLGLHTYARENKGNETDDRDEKSLASPVARTETSGGRRGGPGMYRTQQTLRLHGLETGITNASESFHRMLKRLQNWEERPVDIIARGFSLVIEIVMNH